MSELSTQDISHLGRLARLDLTPEEQDRFAAQLSSVVSYVEELEQVDTSSIAEIRGVTGLANVLAADQPRPADDLAAVDTAVLVAGAPRHKDNFFLVRAVLNEEGGA